MSLHPTRTRLALLEAVHAGAVVEGHEDDHTYWVEAGYEPRKVDARIKEAEAAGWVELPDGVSPFWQLTELGEQTLRGNSSSGHAPTVAEEQARASRHRDAERRGGR